MALRSKLDRAIVAYLQDRGVSENIYPANCSIERQTKNVTVWSHNGTPSEQFSGSYSFQVMIEIENSATQQPNEPNPEKQRAELDELTEDTHDALMQTEDNENLKATAEAITLAGRELAVTDGTPEGDKRAENNADMAEFTCQWWEESGLTGGRPNVEGGAFKEVLMFRAIAAGRVIS